MLGTSSKFLLLSLLGTNQWEWEGSQPPAWTGLVWRNHQSEQKETHKQRKLCVPFLVRMAVHCWVIYRNSNDLIGWSLHRKTSSYCCSRIWRGQWPEGVWNKVQVVAIHQHVNLQLLLSILNTIFSNSKIVLVKEHKRRKNKERREIFFLIFIFITGVNISTPICKIFGDLQICKSPEICSKSPEICSKSPKICSKLYYAFAKQQTCKQLDI